MIKLIRRLLLFAAAAAVVLYLAALTAFQVFRKRFIHDLERHGSVIQTSAGPIEHAIVGEDGPMVLVVPGTFGGFDQARSLGLDLEPFGFRALAVSRPGYLGTPISVGRTPGEQADALAALLDALQLERVAVLAASGGGPAALELAARHPSRVAALVLIAALTGPKEQPPARLPPHTELTDRLFGEGFSTWWELRQYERSGVGVLQSPIFGPRSHQELGRSRARLERFFQLAWFRFPPSLRRAGYLNDRAQFGAFAFDDFERIAAPTLVIHGTDDRNVPIEHADRAASRIPDVEYLRIEGGDHFVKIAMPDMVWDRVATFLRRRAGGE